MSRANVQCGLSAMNLPAVFGDGDYVSHQKFQVTFEHVAYFLEEFTGANMGDLTRGRERAKPVHADAFKRLFSFEPRLRLFPVRLRWHAELSSGPYSVVCFVTYE